MAKAAKYSVIETVDSLEEGKRKLASVRRGRPAAEQALYRLTRVLRGGDRDYGRVQLIRFDKRKKNASAGLKRKTKKRVAKRKNRTKKNAVMIRGGKVKRAVFGRRNPDIDDSEESAADMFKTFHGRESESVTEFEFAKTERLNVAECGKLRYLKVLTEDGSAFKLQPKGVLVCTSPEGGQLYFVGGDQELDVEGLGLGDSLPKDLLSIGEVFEIEYHTTKDFHNFEPVDYFHQFGEESGVLPKLGYDNLNAMFYLEGGNYQVRREGIVD